MIKFYVVILIFGFCILNSPGIANCEKWQGVDEGVVERIAREHGRHAWRPFINTEQGDILLFAFLLAGAVGGFALGFYWRKFFYERDIR